MSDEWLYDCFDDTTMKIQIDTLMGTSFDIKVSQSDTVRKIKQRIQSVEGIPVHQQTLIYESQELKDSGRLCDTGIRHGSKIKLVLGMRGGPISTRRLSLAYEHHVMFKELMEIFESTRDEIRERLSPGSKLSVLVFREGDIINLLRIVENEDGTYSPYASATAPDDDRPTTPTPTTAAASSARKYDRQQMAFFEKIVEDTRTMTKLLDLRKRMEQLQTRRQHRNVDTSGTDDVIVTNNDADDANVDGEMALKDKHRNGGAYHFLHPPHHHHHHRRRNPLQLYQPITNRLHEESEDGVSVSSTTPTIDNDEEKEFETRRKTVRLARLLLERTAQRENRDGDEDEFERHLWDYGGGGGATCKIGVLKRRQSRPDDRNEDASEDILHLPQLVGGYRGERTPLYGRRTQMENDMDEMSEKLDEMDVKKIEKVALPPIGVKPKTKILESKKVDGAVVSTELPPIDEPSMKKRSRCQVCNRRLNITNIYDCRCGNIFCAQHRYPETHHCDYDYKSEGRKLLELQNPLVTANKINRF